MIDISEKSELRGCSAYGKCWNWNIQWETISCSSARGV